MDADRSRGTDDGGSGGDGEDAVGGRGKTATRGSTPDTGGAVTVLLVDDDETWARTNARILERQRDAFTVTTATDLAEAREAYEGLDPECVVCDYQLERGTGLDLLSAVREDDPDRPFVLVTGEGNEAVASDAIRRRVTDYVRKSTVADNTDLLARLVETGVRTYRTERALERERRSKDAMLDLVRATTSRRGMAADFCRHLVAERGYAAAWFGTYSPGEGVVPRATAGGTAYPDEVLPPGTAPDAGDEPALVALAEGRPCVVDSIDPTADDTDDAGPAAWRGHARSSGFRSAAAVPVERPNDGSPVGVLAVYAAGEMVADENERDLLADYGTTLGFALRTAEWKQSLLSASSVVADVLVRDDDVPLVAFLRELPRTSLSVRTTVLRDGERLLYVVEVPDASVDSVRTAAGSLDGVELASVGADTEPRLYELVVEGPTPERLVVERGGRFVRTVVEGGCATVSVATSTRDDVPDLLSALADRYAEVSLVSVRPEGDVDVTSPVAELTRKQRQALELAFYEGYFDRPRRNVRVYPQNDFATLS